MVIPLLANQDLTPMLVLPRTHDFHVPLLYISLRNYFKYGAGSVQLIILNSTMIPLHEIQ